MSVDLGKDVRIFIPSKFLGDAKAADLRTRLETMALHDWLVVTFGKTFISQV